MKRRPPNLTELLGTALLQLFPDVMTFEEAKALTPAQVIARARKSYDVHHHVYVALGGTNHPANMSWLACATHDDRTYKIDVPAIAKVRRSVKRQAAELIRPTHAASTDAKPKRKSRLPNRAFPAPPPGAKYDWKRKQWVRA